MKWPAPKTQPDVSSYLPEPIIVANENGGYSFSVPERAREPYLKPAGTPAKDVLTMMAWTTFDDITRAQAFGFPKAIGTQRIKDGTGIAFYGVYDTEKIHEWIAAVRQLTAGAK